VREKKSALMALAVWASAEIAYSTKSHLTHGQSYIDRLFTTFVVTIVLWWILPFLIVYRVEKKDARHLGLVLERKLCPWYAVYATVGLVFPAFSGVVLDSNFVLDLIEQIVSVGLAEEFFYRGYLQNRFCKWLGDWRGLLFSATLFGSGHLVSRIVTVGFDYIGLASTVAAQTFVGGLLLGLIFLRANNIWASAVLHISSNMYLNHYMQLLEFLRRLLIP